MFVNTIIYYIYIYIETTRRVLTNSLVMKSTEAAFTDLEAVGNLGNSRSSINITSQSCYPLRNIGLLGMLVNII